MYRRAHLALSNLHKDLQGDVFEFTLTIVIEVALVLHLWLHVLVYSLIYKNGRSYSSKGGPVNSQVVKLIKTMLHVFRNYVPNKYITIDNKDPVWMNEIIKSKMKTKNKLYQQYIQSGRFESDLVFIQFLIAELNDLISYTKDLYYENLAKN